MDREGPKGPSSVFKSWGEPPTSTGDHRETRALKKRKGEGSTFRLEGRLEGEKNLTKSAEDGAQENPWLSTDERRGEQRNRRSESSAGGEGL